MDKIAELEVQDAGPEASAEIYRALTRARNKQIIKQLSLLPHDIASLKIMCRSYYDYQDERIALDNRLGMKKDGDPKKNVPARNDNLLMYLKMRRDDILDFERAQEKEIKRRVVEVPIWKAFLESVVGCGPVMAAVCITEFNIQKADTVSKMWRFSGLDPSMTFGKVPKKIKGKKSFIVSTTLIKADKKTKGFLCPFNQFLRAKLCGVLGGSFLRSGSPYRKFYDDRRTRLEAENKGEDAKNPSDPEHPKANHQHKMANRHMVKEFLKDLYDAWRTLEGLPVRKPYAEEYLGRKHHVAEEPAAAEVK